MKYQNYRLDQKEGRGESICHIVVKKWHRCVCGGTRKHHVQIIVAYLCSCQLNHFGRKEKSGTLSLSQVVITVSSLNEIQSGNVDMIDGQQWGKS